MSMGKVIAIANQKGGVGKTTTTINLSAALAETGKRILVIDIDPQGNTTSGFGVDKNTAEHTVYETILGQSSAGESIQATEIDNLYLLPANVQLSGAEIELVALDNKEYLLAEEMDYIRDDYDYILIDCPPALSMLTVNALTAADAVLVPIQCEYYALEGLSQLMQTIELIRERLNDRLIIMGVVFTMYDSRTNLSSQVVETVKAHLDVPVYDTMIPRNVRLAEAPSYGMPILKYDTRSAGADSYRKLAKELLRREKAQGGD